MLIKQCLASKPGLFDGKTLNLDDRITVIVGKNNSGKSYLARALVDILWGRYSENYLLRDNARDNLYMEVLLQNSQTAYRFTSNSDRYYSIKGIPDNSQTEKTLIDLKTESSDSAEAPRLREQLKAAEESQGLIDFFSRFEMMAAVNFSFLPSPMDIMKEGSLKYSVFRRFFLEDHSHFYTLFRDLQKQFQRDGGGSPLLNGIEQLENELRDLDKKINLIDLQQSKFSKILYERDSLEEEIRRIDEELDELNRRKSMLQGLEESLHQAAELDESISAIMKEIEAEKQKKETCETMKQELDRLYPQFTSFTGSQKQNLKRIQEIYRECRDINESIESYRDRIDGIKQKFRNIVLSLIITSLITILPLLTDLFFKIPYPRKAYFLTGLLLLPLMGSASFLIFHLLTSKSRVLQKLLQDRGEIEARIEKLLDENDVPRERYVFESLYEFLLQYFEEYGDYTEKRMELFKIGETLKEERAIREMFRRMKDLQSNREALLARIREELDASGNGEMRDPDPDIISGMISKVVGKITETEEKAALKRNILEQLNIEIQKNDYHSDEKETLARERSRCSDNLRGIQSHKTLLTFLLELMEEALERREEKQLSRLATRAREVFHYLTDNQYITVIDDNMLRSFIRDNRYGDDFNPSLIHLLLLSVKVSMTDFLRETGLDIPFIIDDPFLFMDDDRAERLKKVLKEIAESRQIIIFTHDSKIKDWGTRVEL